MKIVFCLNHFLPQQVAGTEIYTFSLIKEMMSRGVDCLVVIPHYESRKSRTYTVEGVRVIQYAEPSVIDRDLNMGKKPAEGLPVFKKILKKEKPDIVHFQEMSAGNGISIFNVKAAKEIGAKIIMTFHLAVYSCRTGDLMYKSKELCDGIIDEKKCSICFIHKKGYQQYSIPLWTISEQLFKLNLDSSNMQNRIGTALSVPFIIKQLRENLMEISNNCDQLVVLTDWYRKVLSRNGIPKKKMKLILQGLPLKETVEKVEHKFNNLPLRLMFIGRISHLKGIHHLINAMRHLDPLKVSLHIFGSTTDLEYETHWKRESVAMPNVKWMGQLEQAQVIPTMRRYHALVLPSTFSEMSPLVIQEAFAAGIPVVASNIYGNAEQVNHDVNGLLFEFNNADSLAIQINRLVDQESLLEYLTSNVKPPRSFAQVGDEYYHLYRELLKKQEPVQ